jgi:hypothetical protein
MCLTTFIIIFTLGSCKNKREKNAEEILENPQMRREVFNAILKNPNYTDSLLNKMMVTGNPSMMKRMYMSDKMDSLFGNDNQVMDKMLNHLTKKMEADNVVCDKTCDKMMESDNIRKYMERRILKK